MPDLRCPNCGASASLPLGMTCSDHRPVALRSPNDRWGTCCPHDPECDHSFLDLDELTRWINAPITDDEAAGLL